jgi:hypothetical protein
MLDAQVFVDLVLKFGARMHFVRHDNWLGEGSDQKAFRFNTSGYSLVVALLLLRVRGIFDCYSGGDP